MDVLQIGNPLLREKSRMIKNLSVPEVQKTIDNLIEVMRKNDLIGEAAPQIGQRIRVFVTEVRGTKYREGRSTDDLRVFINPEIINVSDQQVIGYEGCGSVVNAQLFGPVKRPKRVKIKALDRQGSEFILEADGLLARVIQHEYDHLEGILFTDKISDWKKVMAKEEYLKMKAK